jgi:alkylhydroperoxidase family enzyme
MPANAFDLFMAQHGPAAEAVVAANSALWERSALDAVIKERVRIALAEEIGCSYCVRFRTDMDGRPILDADAAAGDEGKSQRREAFARAIASNTVTDELTVEIQEELTPAEFADFVFSVGWFIGMQHVGRMMHWDDACPVAPIRALVESGEAA